MIGAESEGLPTGAYKPVGREPALRACYGRVANGAHGALLIKLTYL